MQSNQKSTSTNKFSIPYYQAGGVLTEDKAIEEPVNAPINQEPIAPSPSKPVTEDIYNPAAVKEDWFETRVTAPHVSTKNLFSLYGLDGFNDFKAKEEYWKNDKIRDTFAETYGSEAKARFDEAYDNSKKEYARFQLGEYQRSKTGFELIRDDLSSLRFGVTQRFSNMTGTLKQGDDWSTPTKDYRENFSFIKTKQVDENGVESYAVKEYSPELLEELEKDPSFGGLAYSDAFYGMDPHEGVNGLYFNVIHDGRVLDEVSGVIKDVRDDQVVSRWDLDTGPTSVLGMFDVNLGQVFKNNKLEADGVLDYVKILVKAPMNMAVNVMDTAVQLTRASVAGGYGIANIFTDDDLDVRSSEVYKWLTTKGVKLKGNTTSMSREALQDGFFGSLEAALTTTADVALQIALAGALGRAGAGLPGFLDKSLKGEALIQAQTRSAEVFVRGTLTAMAVKDSYNEAIENGYSTSEASVITGAMGVAMWKATKYASYILGDYEVKVLRGNIKAAMQEEQSGMLKTLFASVAKTAVEAGETKSKYALESMQRAVSKVFGKATKMLPSNRMLYIAQQEAFEEMTEELFQDGVKQVASAYGTLINNAQAAGKGRYTTIFDDGYFKDAAMRYITSGVAGGMGGMMGMIGRRVELSPITSTSSMTDILMDGKKAELLSVLTEMKNEGALGPKTLSTEYNEALEAFEPIIQGSGSESLADMVFKQYEHDINVVDTFIHQGMFGQARSRIEASEQLKDFVDNNSMRKDYVKLMGSVLEFHNSTGLPMSVYDELDEMTEGDFSKRIPGELRKIQDTIKQKTKEIDDIKAAASVKIPANNATGTKDEKPKTTDKKEKKDKVIGETEEAKLTRLEKEVKFSATVKDKDLITMLSNYRKIRAISTGAAAEYYLLQNELSDNTMLGAKYNRVEKYADLGEEPLKDMMMAMRFRSLADNKIHEQTDVKANEIESKILGLKDSDEDSVDVLISTLKTQGYSLLSEKALKAIVKMYDKLDIKEVGAAFDQNNEFSIFEKGADGKASEEDMLSLYKEIMLLSPFSENADALDSGALDDKLTPEVVSKYFKSLSKDIRKALVPEWEDAMGDNSYRDNLTGDNLIDRIVARGSARLLEAVNASGVTTLQLKEVSDKSNEVLKSGNFFKKESFKRKGIKSLFKRARNGVLANESLVEDGLSVVAALKDSGHEGIYTLTDHSEIDEVLEQIDVRLEIAKVLGTMTEGPSGKGMHYIKMLANFRKNVLDIIDFKYDYGSFQDTYAEDHSYKGYTVASDFFVDFIFDPIALLEVINKDPKLHTEEDKMVMNEFQMANSLLKPSGIKITGNEDIDTKARANPQPEDLYAIDTPMDEKVLTNYLDSIYKDRLFEAEELFDGDLIWLPQHVFGDLNEEVVMMPYFLGGTLELAVAKWLFEKTRGVIVNVASTNTILPYIEAKNKDNQFSLRTFRNLIEDDNIVGLKRIVEEESPEVFVALQQDMNKMPKNDMGALNIEIENLLFRIFNNTDLITPLSEEESSVLVENIENHVYDINIQVRKAVADNKDVKKASEKVKSLSVLIGALTTDFTPFYSKFKRDIENMSPFDNIVVASQEHAAKHAGAYLYSKKYRELADALSTHRLSFDKHLNIISAVYVTGIAGAGKSSAVIQTGLRLAVEILEDSGATNTAVLPVSTYDAQIDIVTKSVGDLSKGLKGLSVNELHKLLIDAVTEKDAEAIATLSTVGIIAIDEATYVEATAVDDYETQLESINSLITSFNNRENIAGHQIGLLLLGDPRQSGASKTHNDVMYDVSLELKRVHPIAYLDFSFRSRNNFLVDSLAAVVTMADKVEATSDGSADFIRMEAGTKYGTTGGKYYGLRMVDAADKESSDEFYKVLNDKTLVDNIEANIQKAIAENQNRPDGAPEVKFKVLISPADIVSYNGTPSKIKTLSETPEYAEFFKTVSADMVGGSEANYVIGEIVNPDSKSGGEITYLKSVAKKLTTLATRAFDFAVIVNRNDSIIIPFDAASKEIPDGQVISHNPSLDNAAKEKLKKNYLEIFKNVGADTSQPIVTKKAIIPGASFVIPKDTFALNYTSIVQFTEGDKSILSHRGNSASFESMSQETKDITLRYLEKIKELLASDDIDQSADLILELDAMLTQEVKDDLSQEIFEDLVGLQVFVADITDANIARIINAHIDVAIDTLNMTEDIRNTSLSPGITVADVMAEVERTVTDPTLKGTYENLFKEVFADQTSDRSDELLEAFLADINDSYSTPGNEVELTLEDPEGIKAMAKLVSSIIYARATIVSTDIPTSLPDLDYSVVSKQLDEFSLWADTLDDDQLVELIKQFIPGASTLKVVLPTNVSEIYSMGFNAESVTKAIYDTAVEVKTKRDSKKKATERYTDNMTRLGVLKTAIGIPEAVIGALDLYTAIGKAERRLLDSIYGKTRTQEDNDKITDIIEIRNLWNDLYRGHSSVFGEDGYGKGFMYRNLSEKETLDDYIRSENRGEGMYTVGVTDYNAGVGKFSYRTGVATLRQFPTSREQKVLSPKQALQMFNYDNTASVETPKKVILRLVKSSRKSGEVSIDVLVMVPSGNTNYVISQLNSEDTNKATEQFLSELRNVVEKDTANSFSVGDTKILDLEIEADIKKFLYTRPGGIITAEEAGNIKKAILDDEYIIAPQKAADGSFKYLTAADFAGKVNLGNTVFAHTHKPIAGDSTKDIGNLLGETYCLFSTNQSTNIDSKSIVSVIKSGGGLDTSNRIQDNAGVISSQLGLMKVDLKAPLDVLGQLLKENADISMGEFTSYFSVALQSHFIDYASKNYKVGEDVSVYIRKTFKQTAEFKEFLSAQTLGDIVEYNIDGALRKFTVTQELLDHSDAVVVGGTFSKMLEKSDNHSFRYTEETNAYIEEMDRDLQRHYSGKSEDYKNKIESVLTKMKGNAQLKVILEDFARAFIMNKAIFETPTTTKKHSILYPSKSGGYIFNINEYLRNNPASVLQSLTLLSDVANYTLKPNITNGSNVYAGTINDAFRAKLSPYLQTSVTGIKVPSIMISKSGTEYIRTAIRKLGESESVGVYSPDQLILLDDFEHLNALESGAFANEMLSLGEKNLSKMLSDVTTLETLIKGNKELESDKILVGEIKVRIKGVLDRVEALKKAGIWDGDPDAYLSDYAKGTNTDSVFRKVLSSILLEYNPKNYHETAVQEAALSILSQMEEADEDILIDHINNELGDERLKVLLEGCKF